MFNDGDLVYIKPKLEYSDKVMFNDSMSVFLGGTYTVYKKLSFGYKLKECFSESDPKVNDDGYWIWDEKWLEAAEQNEIEIEDNEFMNLFNE